MHTSRPVHSRAATIFDEDHSGSMQGCGAVPASATAEEVSMATLAKALNLTPQ
jgi:hypothetical protein